MRPTTFDLDALRSFVLGIELGSFARAAARLDRSTSAVSAQLAKLEQQAGTAILRRAGRGMVATDAGETLLAYARRLLALNDEAGSALHGADLEGWVRLGLQEDFGESLLSDVLGRFARAHPRVRIEARIARNTELLERVRDGRLDLALAWRTGAASASGEPAGDHLATLPLRWIGGVANASCWAPGTGEPLPLVMLEAPCIVRSAATLALDRAGIAWRVAFTSASLSGIWAAVDAGLGLGVRTTIGLPARVTTELPAAWPLPALPSLDLAMHRATATPSAAVSRLETILRQALPPWPSIDRSSASMP